jgi:hypothetical protein
MDLKLSKFEIRYYFNIVAAIINKLKTESQIK